MLFVGLIASLTCVSQDPYVVHPNYSLLEVNPSFAGLNGDIRFQASYRNQFPNHNNTYTIHNTAIDGYIPKYKSGLGISYSFEDYNRGFISSNNFNFNYSYYIKHKEWLIIPSIRLGYFFKKMDLGRYAFGMPSSNSIPPWGTYTSPAKKSNFNIGTGLLVNYKRVYLGGSIYNFSQPDQGIIGVESLHRRYVLHGSTNHDFSKQISMNSSVRFMKQQKFNSILLSTNLTLYRHFIIGAGFGNSSSYFVNAGFIHPFFSAIFLYQRNYSELSSTTVVSYELHLSLNLRRKDSRHKMVDLERW